MKSSEKTKAQLELRQVAEKLKIRERRILSCNCRKMPKEQMKKYGGKRMQDAQDF